jgi:hypothetical protein
MSNQTMTFTGWIEYGRQEPRTATDPADLTSIMHVLSTDDANRLTGDLLRHAAVRNVTIEVGIVEKYRDHAEFMADWYVHSHNGGVHDFDLVLPVVLTYTHGKPVHGGLVVTFHVEGNTPPRYVRFGIHT